VERGTVYQEDYFCGGFQCPNQDGEWREGQRYVCGKVNTNPNNGVTSFDNFFYALLVVFQSVTLEGWSEIMVQVQKTSSRWTSLFFMPLIFIGAFFLLNLTLAVINSRFNDVHNKTKHSHLKKGKSATSKEALEDRKEKSKISARNRWALLKRFLLARRVAR